jgi:hypothetical protein
VELQRFVELTHLASNGPRGTPMPGATTPHAGATAGREDGISGQPNSRLTPRSCCAFLALSTLSLVSLLLPLLSCLRGPLPSQEPLCNDWTSCGSPRHCEQHSRATAALQSHVHSNVRGSNESTGKERGAAAPGRQAGDTGAAAPHGGSRFFTVRWRAFATSSARAACRKGHGNRAPPPPRQPPQAPADLLTSVDCMEMIKRRRLHTSSFLRARFRRNSWQCGRQ